jgi:DNA modification methylase
VGTQLEHGDMLEVLPLLAMLGVQVDAVVTDPPYHLTSVVKRFGADNAAPAQVGATGAYARASAGFMGKKWDGGDIAFRPETWRLVYDVMKPGAHLVAFGGTRTYHRLACAIEDAGFEIRDTVSWLYGTGFPKSHDVSNGIDRAADYRLKSAIRRAAVDAVEAAGLKLPGNSRHDWTAGEHAPGDKWWAEFRAWIPDLTDADRERIEGAIVARVRKTAGWFTQGDIYDIRAAATPESALWDGWGTALKPACELIVLARKPLIGTVAANVLEYGTGALNIDGCRVATAENLKGGRYSDNTLGADGNTFGAGINLRSSSNYEQPAGRWPANVIHDGSDEVLAAFPDVGKSTGGQASLGAFRNGDIYGKGRDEREKRDPGFGDSGSAARFFYCAKATKADRIGSKHPTVKPIALIRYLCRLVTPPGGTILDPFAGSGTLATAAHAEGFNAILVEREAEYIADIQRRIRDAA